MPEFPKDKVFMVVVINKICQTWNKYEIKLCFDWFFLRDIEKYSFECLRFKKSLTDTKKHFIDVAFLSWLCKRISEIKPILFTHGNEKFYIPRYKTLIDILRYNKVSYH